MNIANKTQAGYAEGVVSIITNSLLFILKLWAGITTGSVALMADAWHTMSDSFSSLVVMIAVRLSARRADKDHPFGHGRWEQIASLFVAFLLAVVAYEFLKDSIVQIIDGERVHFGTFGIVATSISIVVKEALARYAFRLARQSDSSVLKADGWHHRTDALSSVVILIGILFGSWLPWIDGALGCLVAMMLFYAAWEIAGEVINKLLGEKPDEYLTSRIVEAARDAYDGDLHFHHFHIHNYVTHREVTFHIRLDSQLSIDQAHQIASRIEQIVQEKFDIEATIHVEPLLKQGNS
ncbi:MAG: cation diffusion facilitator family transporter [Tannerellaceae bacterium]|jgi:cation diffusion facilitator family transporter|nr:cation diffusion facilitator family transporter [Tannerellaceae bacterium]